MSLYIGKDNSSTNALIISKNQMTESALKASTSFSSNIIFNSKFPYATIEYQEFTSITLTTINSDPNWGYKQATLVCDNAVSSAIVDGRRIFLFIDDVLIDAILPSSFSTYLQRYWYYTNVVNSAINVIIHTPINISNITKIKICVLPFRVDFSNVNIPLYGGTVDIGNNQLLINNIDFFKTKFLSSGNVNNTDPNITILGTQYQVINGTSASGAISITTTPTVKITHNNKLIVDGSNSNYIPLCSDSQLSIYTNFITNLYVMGTSGQTDKILIIPSVGTNDIYLVQYKIWSGSTEPTSYSNAYLLKVNQAGTSTVGYIRIPGAINPEPFWFFSVNINLTSDGYLKFSYPLAQAGEYYPITNVYTGPYNCRIRARRVG